LVDLRPLPGLGDIAVDADGARVGAPRVHWRDIEDKPWLATAHPLPAKATCPGKPSSMRRC
jgi:hypothetical protein